MPYASTPCGRATLMLLRPVGGPPLKQSYGRGGGVYSTLDTRHRTRMLRTEMNLSNTCESKDMSFRHRHKSDDEPLQHRYESDVKSFQHRYRLCLALEQKFVHDVYDEIADSMAPHMDESRLILWQSHFNKKLNHGRP
jgi:hypothetical protein